MVRNGYKIARVVDVCSVERGGKRSYKADADTMRTIVVGERVDRYKTVYIPEHNNGGVLDLLDKETVKWN